MESFSRTQVHGLIASFLAVTVLSFAGCASTNGQSDYPGQPVYSTQTRYPVAQPVYSNGQPVYSNGQAVYTTTQPVYQTGQPVYGPAPVVYNAQPVYAADDYVYYPSVEVYYSTSRREYIYREGRDWVARRNPPRYWTQGPYVHVQFRDGPQHHHSEMVRTYPRGWRPNSYDYRDRR